MAGGGCRRAVGVRVSREPDDTPPGWHQDVVVDEAHVRRLLATLPASLSHLRDQPLELVAQGWDNSVWRVGDEHAARLPVRPMAAPLVVNESRWVEQVTTTVRELGVPVPLPVHLAAAGAHPHPWLLVRWVPGEPLSDAVGPSLDDLARPMADVLRRLHRPAPADAPLNPFRGPDLRDLPPPRASAVRGAREVLDDDVVGGLLEVHDEATAARPWPGPRLWCHGDLHARNLVRTPQRGLGLLDFGDVTAGDPAVDLGVWWTAFSPVARDECLPALLEQHDGHVVRRARGWAARFVLGVAGHDHTSFGRTIDHAVRQLLA